MKVSLWERDGYIVFPEQVINSNPDFTFHKFYFKHLCSKKQKLKIQGRFPKAKIIIIPNGHHYCFIAQEGFVHEEMKKFLLK